MTTVTAFVCNHVMPVQRNVSDCGNKERPIMWSEFAVLATFGSFGASIANNSMTATNGLVY